MVTTLSVSDISIVFTYLSTSDRFYSISPFGNIVSLYTFMLGFAFISTNHAYRFSSTRMSRPST
jgi:hypothetical protein